MKSTQKNKGIAPLIILIIALVVVAAGVGGYLVLKPHSAPVDNNEPPIVTPHPASQSAVFLSFAIQPSSQSGGWIMYKDGAKAVLTGKDISSAEVVIVPTGTEVSPANYAKIKMMKVSTSADGIETWEVALSKYILATNFWAEAVGTDGKTVKGQDLGNVGYQEGTISQNPNWHIGDKVKFSAKVRRLPLQPPDSTGFLEVDYNGKVLDVIFDNGYSSDRCFYKNQSETMKLVTGDRVDVYGEVVLSEKTISGFTKDITPGQGISVCKSADYYITKI